MQTPDMNLADFLLLKAGLEIQLRVRSRGVGPGLYGIDTHISLREQRILSNMSFKTAFGVCKMSSLCVVL